MGTNWLDLSEAAHYLGVHFTTLRRWADAGEMEFIRTPGGRRRFSKAALDIFLKSRVQPANSKLGLTSPLENRVIEHARQGVQSLNSTSNSWINRLSEEQRQSMKGTGHRLMALLLQFSSRGESGEVFVEEGRRIAGEYAAICSGVGLTLIETVQVFLFFRRSILEGVYETGFLGRRDDAESQRLMSRTGEFMDELLLELVIRSQASQQIGPNLTSER